MVSQFESHTGKMEFAIRGKMAYKDLSLQPTNQKNNWSTMKAVYYDPCLCCGCSDYYVCKGRNERSGVKIKRSAGEEVRDRRLGYFYFRRPLFV